MKSLRDYFPNTKLFLSDFSTLPDAIEGHRGPVVQTRYLGKSIACTTYLVQKGYFDIFYPTDFEELRKMYEKLVGRSGRVLDHRAFCQQYADLPACRTQSGDIPITDMYENVKVFISD